MRIRTLVENEEKFDRLRILLFINLRNTHPPLYTQNKNDGREIEFVNPITNRGSNFDTKKKRKDGKVIPVTVISHVIYKYLRSLPTCGFNIDRVNCCNYLKSERYEILRVTVFERKNS